MMEKRPGTTTTECATNKKQPNALDPITGSPRHSFSRENEKLMMDRGWSGDGVERMSENVSGADPMERGKRMGT